MAADVATAIHQNRDALFIGDEVGGGYHGNTSGSTKTIHLPHTKVRVRIPIEHYVTTDSDAIPRGRGLAPDVRVVPTGLDTRGGADPVMTAALRAATGAETDTLGA